MNESTDRPTYCPKSVQRRDTVVSHQTRKRFCMHCATGTQRVLSWNTETADFLTLCSGRLLRNWKDPLELVDQANTIGIHVKDLWGRYHGGRRPSSGDSFHSPTVILPSALDKASIMKPYHRRRTTGWGVTARSPTMVTLHDTRFVKWRWWNDGWTVKTVVTWRSSSFMIPAPGLSLQLLLVSAFWSIWVTYGYVLFFVLFCFLLLFFFFWGGGGSGVGVSEFDLLLVVCVFYLLFF